jgi:hypothetical protein
MYGFKDFLLESFDTAHEFHKDDSIKKPKWADESHRYTFKDSAGSEKNVDIHHTHDSAAFAFHDSDKDNNDDKHDATGKLGSKAVKVFSTVKAIIKHHSKAHPHIDNYEFSSSNHEPSRVKLYSRMTKHLRGSSEDNGDITYHRVSADKLR